MPVETRYMRGDQHSINGLTAYKLGTTQTTIPQSVFITTTSTATCYAGIRVWKRSADGTEEEITAGTPVAVVERTASGGGIQSATCDCPQTSLAPTDAIVVRVYLKSGTGLWYEKAVFITEQLGATQLDNVTWTVYYYTVKYSEPETGAWYWEFDFGTSTYNSRIENFVWTPPVVKKAIMKIDKGPHPRSRLIFAPTLILRGIGVQLPPSPPAPTWEDFMEEWF